MSILHTPMKSRLPGAQEALPGREVPIETAREHFVHGRPLHPPFPEHTEQVVFGLGCFWGAERIFWQAEGVWTTSVGYAGGLTPHPTYREVCTGRTGHTEVVMVVYNQDTISYEDMLKLFWESHDPTQGMRQGNDVGTQYRSAIFTSCESQREEATASRDVYQHVLTDAGYGEITTEIRTAPTFYYAEEYHQQYLAKNPDGYCGLGGTGVSCPIGLKDGAAPD